MTVLKVENKGKRITWEIVKLFFHRYLCPNFAASTRKFKFNREDVLTSEEIKLFEKVSYSEHSTSVVEGYETYRAPNFESGYVWKNIFKKVEEQFFKTQNIDFLTKIYNAENDESKISETIQRIRVFQSIFDQIKQTLNIADKNNFEIAFTIHDY